MHCGAWQAKINFKSHWQRKICLTTLSFSQLQVEHPYCYVNPLAVSEASSVTTPPHPPVTQPAVLAPEPRPENRFKASPQRSPGSALVSRGLGTQPTVTLPKRVKKSNTNGCFTSENEWQCRGDDGSKEDIPLKDIVCLKDGKARYTRGQRSRIPLVESFAAKLEADLRRIEYDRQRAEGEVLEAASTPDDDDPLQEPRSPKGRVDTTFLPDTSFTFPYEDIDESTRLQTDVWKPSELEDVFECYNMAAFYSYGATFPVHAFPLPFSLPFFLHGHRK